MAGLGLDCAVPVADRRGLHLQPDQPAAGPPDAAAARAIAKGRQPEPLPESGPTEIEEANRSFNQMVADLNRIESDRA
jgi:hypothetical protein